MLFSFCMESSTFDLVGGNKMYYALYLLGYCIYFIIFISYSGKKLGHVEIADIFLGMITALVWPISLTLR